jgi:hypothetical protein
MNARFTLSPTKSIRSRAVYNIIDLIAEVSGLADALIVFTTAIMSTFITISMLKSFLAHEIGFV